MNNKQKQILDSSKKNLRKDEQVLSGGNQYINPIRKPKKKSNNDGSFINKIYKP